MTIPEPPDEPVAPEPEPDSDSDSPTVKQPGPSVFDPSVDSTPLPGAHRGGFSRAFTGPVGITIESAPVEPGSEDPIDYMPADYVVPPPGLRYSPWALGFAIVGLGMALFVGWAFLLGIVAIIAGVIALRRRESRALCVWAIVLASVSLVYSVGWLVWDGMRAALLGG